MRAVIQRVSKAACRVGSEITGSIDEGLVVLLGIESTDNETDLEWLVQKLVNLRIFEDEKALMNRSIKEVGGDILLISQFTLFALTKKGNRPSFIQAARPETALPLYESAIAQLESLLGKKVATGIFGADMKIELVNDGPVTIVMDTRDKNNH